MQLSDFPIVYLLDPGERLFWGYLLSSAVIAWAVTRWQRRAISKQVSWRAYWLHPSAVLDYQYFFIIGFIKVYLIAPLLFSAHTVAVWTYRATRDYLMPIDDVSYETVALLYTLTLFISSDFTRYWLHRALHASDILWAFHKVHHSAEVLNPVTFYRIHPVESFLFGLRYSLTAGVVTGIFKAFFGAKLSVNQIIGVNSIIFIFSVLGSNLRHSHIYWRFPRWLESVFISPAQHQLHHQYRTSRTNYGGYLAIWDWAFGSLQKSHDTTKPQTFGIASRDRQHFSSLTALLFSPFREVAQRWQHRLKRQRNSEK